VERIVTLNQIPGQPTEFRGTWIKHLTAIWIAPNGPERAKCRFKDEADFTPSIEAISRQSLTGELDRATNKLTISPRLIDCQGQTCEWIVPQPLKEAAIKEDIPPDLKFDLVYKDGQLIDAPQPNVSIVLRRTADLALEMTAITSARNAFWKAFDDSNFDAVVRMQASVSKATREQFAQLRTQTGRVVQANTTVILPASRLVPPGQTLARDTVLCVSQITLADARQVTQVLVLWKEDNQWKVAFLA
jgi:hypothetical protein